MTQQESPPVGEIEEVFQEEQEPFIPAIVGVAVHGPVQVHQLPSVSGGNRSFTMAATDPPKRIANEDPRRRIVRIISDQAFFLGTDANEVATRYGARIPANIWTPVTHQEPLYAQLLVDGTLSVMTENWAS